MTNQSLFLLVTLFSNNVAVEIIRFLLNKSDMKNLRYVIALSMTTCMAYAKNGITYSFSGGRLGDNLMTYVEARWFAYQTGLEFYYRPFKYSDLLSLNTMHKPYRDHDKLRIVSVDDIKKFVQKTDTLYVISPLPLNNNINWDDQIFLAMMKEEISSVGGSPALDIPKNHMSVGLHIRRGGGWDDRLRQKGTIVTAQPKNPDVSFADEDYPTRFAPDSYFIDQLRFVLDKFPHENLYVHIFTDDPRPDLIAAKYEQALANSRLTFGYRKDGNSHDSNVLEDLFMISQCEVVIRSASNFSDIACRLGRTKLEIRPNDFRWKNDVLLITEVEIIQRAVGSWKTQRHTMSVGPKKKK